MILLKNSENRNILKHWNFGIKNETWIKIGVLFICSKNYVNTWNNTIFMKMTRVFFDFLMWMVQERTNPTRLPQASVSIPLSFLFEERTHTIVSYFLLAGNFWSGWMICCATVVAKKPAVCQYALSFCSIKTVKIYNKQNAVWACFCSIKRGLGIRRRSPVKISSVHTLNLRAVFRLSTRGGTRTDRVLRCRPNNTLNNVEIRWCESTDCSDFTVLFVKPRSNSQPKPKIRS